MILDRRALLRGLHWGSVAIFTATLLTAVVQHAGAPDDAPGWLFATTVTLLTALIGWASLDAWQVSERRLAVRAWVMVAFLSFLALIVTGYAGHPSPTVPSLVTPLTGALAVASFAFNATVGRWVTIAAAILLGWARWDAAPQVSVLVLAVIFASGGLTAATVIDILLGLADRIQRGQEALWDEREQAARASTAAASQVRWDGLIHDKVLGALRLAGRDGTLIARTAAVELAGEASLLLSAGAREPHRGRREDGPDDARAIDGDVSSVRTAPGPGLRARLESLAGRHGLIAECTVTVTASPELRDGLDELLSATDQALANVAAHAGVREVRITGRALPDTVVVTVRDQGRGFDASRDAWGRAGIARSIAGRMAAAGGTAIVESTPGVGTTVTLSIAKPVDTLHDQSPASSRRVWSARSFRAVAWFGAMQNIACVIAGWSLRDATRSSVVLVAVALATQAIAVGLLYLPSSRLRVARLAVLAMGLTVLTGTLNLREPGAAGWQYWFFGALMPAAAVVILRFPTALAWATSGAVTLGLILGQLLTNSLSAAVVVDNVPAFLFLIAAVWGVRRALDGATASVASASTAYGRLRLLTASMEEADRIAAERSRRVGARVGQMLTRIAAGEELSRADRRQCLAMEAATRDELVAHHLVTQAVAGAVRAARDRGVKVVLSADDTTTEALPAFRNVVHECVVRASDGSRVLALWRPDGRGRLGSVSVVDARFTADQAADLRHAVLTAMDGYAVSLTIDEDAVLIDVRDGPVAQEASRDQS